MIYSADIYHHDPRIEVIDNFLSHKACQHFIDLKKNALKRALVVNNKGDHDKKEVTSKGRTGSNAWVDHHESLITLETAKRVSKIVNLPFRHAEKFQVIHYAENQEYRPHFDTFDVNDKNSAQFLGTAGQRLTTAILYLNTVPEGGATIFPKIDIIVEAKMGRLVIFQNCKPGTNERHPLSLHGGMPIKKGEKWAINLWFREKIYRN